jgi:hypothetical protein
MKNKLTKLIGNLPLESGFKKKMRIHQAWWRTFVLVEEPGQHPVRKNETIGNTILYGRIDRKNFLSQNIIDAVEETIQERKVAKSGILEEDRLFNNLLSSQPLCFNFFGELKKDTVLALRVLQCFYPELTEVLNVKFEFAPDEKYTNDNSAFDVAFEVMAGDKKGLLGIECKYTDFFSPKKYDREEYLRIYNKSRNTIFMAPYKNFIVSKFNQLFRNQLIGEALVQNKEYDFIFTGLFCHQSDNEAQNIAAEFQSMLKDGKSKFRVITYREYLETIQQLDISWEQRELSMLLWARYCGMKLSEEVLI